MLNPPVTYASATPTAPTNEVMAPDALSARSRIAVAVTDSQEPGRAWPHLRVLGWLANAVLFGVALLDTLHFSPHSDNLWQLNLVRQLRKNSRVAGTLVDANRIFPDLVVAAGLDRLWNGFGFELSGTLYVRCVVVLNIVLLILVSDSVRRRFGAVAGATSSALLLLLIATNEYFLEVIRPGFHTTASLILLIWMVRRFVPHRRLTIGDVLLLSALCISSRIFLVMVVTPCLIVQFVFSPSGLRCRRCLPLLGAGLLSAVGWLALRLVPHFYFVAFDSSPHLGVMGGLPLEFVRNATGRPFMAEGTPLWVRCSWLYSTTAGLTVIAAVFVVFARGRYRLRTETAQLCAVVGLSLVIGSVSMRMVNYVVEGRMYVLVLPIIGSVVCVSVVLPDLARRWGAARPKGARQHKVAVVVLLCVATVCGVGNSVAIASSGQHDRYATVAALLRSAHVLDRPGLATYWPAYELAVANEGIDVRLIDDSAGPRFWVNNSWDLFREGQGYAPGPSSRISWVLAMRARNKASETIPTADHVRAMFGEPTRIEVVTSVGSGEVPVLYVYDHGVDLTRFKKLWIRGMGLRRL